MKIDRIDTSWFKCTHLTTGVFLGVCLATALSQNLFHGAGKRLVSSWVVDVLVVVVEDPRWGISHEGVLVKLGVKLVTRTAIPVPSSKLRACELNWFANLDGLDALDEIVWCNSGVSGWVGVRALEVVPQRRFSLGNSQLDGKFFKNDWVLPKWVGVVRAWERRPAFGTSARRRDGHTGVGLTGAVPLSCPHVMSAADQEGTRYRLAAWPLVSGKLVLAHSPMSLFSHIMRLAALYL